MTSNLDRAPNHYRGSGHFHVMDHLSIDLFRCIGCSACASVCIRGNIVMEVGHPSETGGGMGCFDCGHCLAICPENAISLTRYPDFEPREYDPRAPPIAPADLMDLMERRRSSRWFTTDPVTEEEFGSLFRAAGTSPSVQNSADVRFVVIDRDLRRFMLHIADIMSPRADELPRIRQLIDYLNDPFPMGNNPLLWEGRQMILAFSKHREDSVIAMARIELMACAMGLGGFYSHWIQMADDEDHGRFMGFFPGMSEDLVLGAVFVIGHPRSRFRRTVPRDVPDVRMM